MKILTAVTLAMLGLSGAVPCAAQPTEPYFIEVTASHLPAGLVGPTMDVGVADIDGDGDLDLVLAMEFERNRLLLNDGEGRFTDASADRLPGTRRDSEDVGIADFDSDGDLDLVFVSEDDLADELFLNDGSARFTDASDRLAAFARRSNALEVADVDLDGHPDLIIGNNGANEILLGDGSGRFVADGGRRLAEATAVTQDIELGDIDGDGDLDLAAANEGLDALLINDGQGFFTDEARQRLRPAPRSTSREVDFGDVDRDGDLDLLFADVDRFLPTGAVQNRLYLNDGRGFFTDASAERLPPDVRRSFDADFIDVDGDSDLDIVTSNLPEEAYRVLLNDGRGFFTDRTEDVFPPGIVGNGFDSQAADFNGDGILDLYLASRFGPDRLLFGTLDLVGCSDLRPRLVVRRCRAGRLRAQVRLRRRQHSGETVTLGVDGEPFDVEIRGKRAKLTHCCFEPGEHLVELLLPAGCLDPKLVVCTE